MTVLDEHPDATGPAGSGDGPAQARSTPARRRRRHTARWVAIAIAVLGAGLVGVLATRPPAIATEVNSPLVGQRAPALAGTTVAGQGFSLASLSGHWVFVNFFASWCPPCQQEEPELVAFAYHHRGPSDAAVVGVVFDDAASSARSFLSQSGATWPTLANPGGSIALAYGVRGPPETFLVSPAGMVVAHFDGPVTAAFLDHWLHRAQQGT